MNRGSSDQVRKVAKRLYIDAGGTSEPVRINIGELQKALLREGFPSNHIRQIRTSLESELFWEPLGWRMLSAKNQPDRVGTTLVFVSARSGENVSASDIAEDPLLKLRGVLKGAMREGAAAFLRELRRDHDDEQSGEGRKVA
jgi:hypothetical protein